MKFILTRGGKDETWKKCRCNLHIDMNRQFVVYFDQTTPEIGLNDGNFHTINELNGIVHNLSIGLDGIALEGCFVNIGGKWHRDSFLFRFDA